MVFILSVAVNLLMLTGPLFMLQIYDRVLGSRSEATLVALFGLVAFLYLMMGTLDHARGRIMARVGARLQDTLDARVFRASMVRMARNPNDRLALTGLRDLEAVQRLWAAPVFLALFDAPWTPMFIALIWMFHPLMGALALGVALVLLVLMLLNQRLTRAPIEVAQSATLGAERMAGQLRAESEAVRALGMQGAALDRWQQARRTALRHSLDTSDRGGMFSAWTKTFRLFVQSAMLALGAWLVLEGEITPGVMIAASIILGRALAPIEQVIGQWAAVARAREGWANLAALLSQTPALPPRVALPRPRARLSVENAMVIPPGASRPVLQGLSLSVSPGQALGIIGASAAGKSSLARLLIGAWPLATGRVTLDGAALDQYDSDTLGRYIGYLPQRVTLFDGTVAENIARLDTDFDHDAVIRAAKRAGAHDIILGLPDGYNTPITANGGGLTGGQMQRVGLARALYGDPVLVVLDEPNSNLDNDGSQALNGAIRQLKSEGAAVLVIAHRPQAIQECDLLLMLAGGAVAAFGPRDEVLRKVARNHTGLLRPGGGGGDPAPPQGSAPQAGPSQGAPAVMRTTYPGTVSGMPESQAETSANDLIIGTPPKGST